ncbi:MAG: hypothetical protein RXS25_39580 [Paraburkholderia sp.]|uniref:hypothetical protein n=1 Tax=Paraburkholderia sp. TaxID=1926495 RepID=UPI00397808D3
MNTKLLPKWVQLHAQSTVPATAHSYARARTEYDSTQYQDHDAHKSITVAYAVWTGEITPVGNVAVMQINLDRTGD